MQRVLHELYLRHRKGVMLSVLSAVLYFVGFCGFDQFYLAWICFVPVLWAVDDPTVSPRAAFGYGWVFGTVTILGGYTWLADMLRTFGGLSFPLSMLVLTLFAIAHGLLWAVWLWLVHYLSVIRKIRIVWTVPTALVVCEWLFPSLFPTYLGNSQYRQLTFIQSAELFGPTGLSFILAMVSAVLYRVIATRRSVPRPFPTLGVGVCAALVGTNFLYGWLSLADNDDTIELARKKVRVGVVQTNMGIFEKHQRPEEGLRRHRQQSLEVEKLGAELIVWPESGYNRGIPTGMTNVGSPVLGPLRTPLLFGGIRVQGSGSEREIYNTAFLTDGDGNVLGTYDKTYLLAFGEYMPFGDWFPVLYDLSPNTSRFQSGNHQRPLEFDGVRYGVLICYEDVLTDFVRDAMKSKPNVLVNITNDAWFGKSREPYIHLALSVFRAVEQRRFLVRATNTGVSAIIDSGGRILSPTPVFARANFVEEVAVLEGATLYQRLGPWLPWICLATLLVWSRSGLTKLMYGFTRGWAARATKSSKKPARS